MSNLDLIFPTKLYYKEAFFLRFTAFDYNTSIDELRKISSEEAITSLMDDFKNTFNDKDGGLSGVVAKGKQFASNLSSPETSKTPTFRCHLPISSAIKEDLKLQWKKAENIMTGNFSSEYTRTQVETLQTVVSGLLGAWGSVTEPIKRALSTENLSVANKRYIYPNYGYMFEGVGHRNFNFEYKLIPANQEEADIIIKIINGLKYFSLPGQESMGNISTVLKYPAFWNIEIMGLKVEDDGSVTKINALKDVSDGDSKTTTLSKIQKLVQFQDLVLDNISITYGKDGTGEFYYYKDGMPSEINIRMSFTEMKFLTRETSGIDGKSLMKYGSGDSKQSIGMNIKN